MKKSSKSLLLIAFLIGVSYCADCTNYTDDKDQCVDKCVPPLITSVSDKKCISIENCTKNVDLQSLQCLDSCPEFFSPVTKDNQTFKICVPCFFQDAEGNCYDKCPQPYISDVISNKCIQNVSDCKGYYFKEQQMCLDSCPFRSIASINQNQKVCEPCEKDNKCNTVDINSCKQKISSDKMICENSCPPLEIPLAPVQGQNYIQCQKCPQDKKFVSMDGLTCLTSCESNQLIEKRTMRCIEPMQCDKFVMTENKLNFCVPQCPPDQAPSTVDGQQYLSCTACDAKKVFDPVTKQCTDTCTIKQTFPDNKIKCLKSIFECQGFISLDSKQCLQKCEDGQLIRPTDLPGQFNCIAACYDKEFKVKNDKNVEMCLKVCPQGTTADDTKKTCTPPSDCKGILSLDGRQCLDKCPNGQMPFNPQQQQQQQNNNNGQQQQTGGQQGQQQGGQQQGGQQSGNQQNQQGQQIANQQGQQNNADGKQNNQQCRPCQGKISSDGKSCNKECASNELFDADLNQCVSQDKCSNKIINAQEKICSEKCKQGEILQIADDNSKKCLKNPTECLNFVSADGRSCVKQCDSNQAQITSGNTKFCRPCPMGVSNDGKACKTKEECNIFDVDTQKCVDTCSKYKQQDGRICASKCIPPQVNRPGDTQACYDSCDKGQVLTKNQGCIAQENCNTYISSNGALCVQNCLDIMEAENLDASIKVCVKCSDTQIPIITNNKVQCVDKSSNTASDAKLRANSLNSAFNGITELSVNQKEQIKDEIKKLAADMENGIKDTKKNAQLSKDDQKQQIKGLIESLKEVAKQFQQKIKNSSEPSSDSDENKLALLSDEFNLIAEKKKFGHAFKTQFNSEDFKSTLNSADLQIDLSNLDPTLASKVISDLDSLQITNTVTNPYCSDENACGQSSFFQVQGSRANRRVLAEQQAQTYQTTFNSDASKISKTICVSYDPNGIMSLAVSTSADKETNKITCTFYDNASLYYDSTCQYIDPTICNSNTNTNTNTNNNNNNNNTDNEVTSSTKIIVSFVAGLLYILI